MRSEFIHKTNTECHEKKQSENKKEISNIKTMTIILKPCNKRHQKQMTNDRQKKNVCATSLVSKEFESKMY